MLVIILNKHKYQIIMSNRIMSAQLDWGVTRYATPAAAAGVLPWWSQVLGWDRASRSDYIINVSLAITAHTLDMTDIVLVNANNSNNIMYTDLHRQL